jgi:hypothetical protein
MIAKIEKKCKLRKTKSRSKQGEIGEKVKRFCDSIQVALTSNRTWIDHQSNLDCPKRVLYSGSQAALF